MFSNNPFRIHRAIDQVLNESKFLIPEEIPANERTAFHGAAAGAAKDGKTSFSFAGKKYPVTMKKDLANKIADQKEATHTTDFFVGHKHAAKAGMGVKVHSKGADGDNVTISHSDPKKLQKYVDNHLGGGKIKEDAGIPHKYTVDLYHKNHGSHDSFMKKAKAAGINAKYSGVNDDGKVKVSLNHHDNSDGGTIHKFLKKHYDKDMTHSNMQTMKTGSSSVQKEVTARSSGYGIRNKVSDMPGVDYSWRDKYKGGVASKDALKKVRAKSDAKRAEYRKKMGMKEDFMNEEYSKTNKASITIKHGYDEGDGPDNKKFAKYINKNTGATVKHHKDGSTMSFHGSDHQIHKALQHHHSDDKKGLGDLNYHKKGMTHSDDHVDGQHSYKAEGTTFREKLMSIYENDKASHYKSATKPETMDDQLKGAGAKQMKADLTGGDTKPADMEKQSHADAAKAGRAGPGTKARTNDNKKGDKKAMASATPVNDPTAKIVRMEAKELPHQEAIDDHRSHSREHKDNRFDNPKTSGKHHMAAYHAHQDAADHLENGRIKEAKASAEKALDHAKKAKAAGGEDHVGETANILKKHHSAKTEAYGISGNKISSSLLAAIAMVGEDYTHEIDVMDDHVKKIVSSAKKAGIKAKIHTMNGPGGGNPVVHIGHKDDDHVHKFLKKHYDPDFKKSDLKHHKIG